MVDVSKISDGTTTYNLKDSVARSGLSDKQDVSNLVTSLSASSTDTQYPSAKCVYDLIGDIESVLAAINGNE